MRGPSHKRTKIAQTIPYYSLCQRVGARVVLAVAPTLLLSRNTYATNPYNVVYVGMKIEYMAHPKGLIIFDVYDLIWLCLFNFRLQFKTLSLCYLYHLYHQAA